MIECTHSGGSVAAEPQFIAIAAKYDSLTVMNAGSTRDFLFFAIKKQSGGTLPEVVPMAARYP